TVCSRSKASALESPALPIDSNHRDDPSRHSLKLWSLRSILENSEDGFTESTADSKIATAS
ncbi:MAG TPA: hypothetical protein VLH08_19570, partial [Acidobacteriota bacterium]|nr:hypothetical protein [Acidobacteriota bacterium]